MLRPGGYTVETTLEGNAIEGETYWCGHCGAHTHIRPFQRASDVGGMCKGCMKTLCPRCAREYSMTLECAPLEELIKKIEKEHAS
jgi:hypothetical protein